MQNRIYEEISHSFVVLTRLLLKTGMTKADMAEVISRLQAALRKLKTAFAGQLAGEVAVRRAEYSRAGLPEKLAAEIASLPIFALVPEIMQIAERTGEPLVRAAENYIAVSQTFRIGRLLAAGGRILTSDHYENLALARSIDQIASARRDIVISALSDHGKESFPFKPGMPVDRIRINRILEELSSLSDGGDPNLARITVAAGILTDLARDRAR